MLLAKTVPLSESLWEIWAVTAGFRVPPRLAPNAPQQRAAAVAADLAHCLLPNAAGSPPEPSALLTNPIAIRSRMAYQASAILHPGFLW